MDGGDKHDERPTVSMHLCSYKHPSDMTKSITICILLNAEQIEL